MTYNKTNDRAAVVSPGLKWLPIDANTPRGAKVLLINKAARVATIGSVGTHETFFDFWCYLPTFDREVSDLR